MTAQAMPAVLARPQQKALGTADTDRGVFNAKNKGHWTKWYLPPGESRAVEGPF